MMETRSKRERPPKNNNERDSFENCGSGEDGVDLGGRGEGVNELVLREIISLKTIIKKFEERSELRQQKMEYRIVSIQREIREVRDGLTDTIKELQSLIGEKDEMEAEIMELKHGQTEIVREANDKNKKLENRLDILETDAQTILEMQIHMEQYNRNKNIFVFIKVKPNS